MSEARKCEQRPRTEPLSQGQLSHSAIRRSRHWPPLTLCTPSPRTCELLQVIWHVSAAGSWTSGVHVVGATVAAGSTTFPPPDRSGASRPVGRIKCPCALVPVQSDAFRRWHPCCCRCLLRGCERWFLPPLPQARYCSPTCRKAADHWQSWRAGQTYRATNQGKEPRGEKARRHREREQQRSTLAEPAPQSPPIEPAFPVIELQATLTSDSGAVFAVANLVFGFYASPCGR